MPGNSSENTPKWYLEGKSLCPPKTPDFRPLAETAKARAEARVKQPETHKDWENWLVGTPGNGHMPPLLKACSEGTLPRLLKRLPEDFTLSPDLFTEYPHQWHHNALEMAIKSGYTAQIRKAGIPLEKRHFTTPSPWRDKDHRSALYLAAARRTLPDLANFNFEWTRDDFLQTEKYGRTVLQETAGNALLKHLPAFGVKFKKADFLIPDALGRTTALKWAAIKGELSELHDQGYRFTNKDVRQPDKDGKTALYWSLHHGHADQMARFGITATAKELLTPAAEGEISPAGAAVRHGNAHGLPHVLARGETLNWKDLKEATTFTRNFNVLNDSLFWSKKAENFPHLCAVGAFREAGDLNAYMEAMPAKVKKEFRADKHLMKVLAGESARMKRHGHGGRKGPPPASRIERGR